jgi:hypothetical protein
VLFLECLQQPDRIGTTALQDTVELGKQAVVGQGSTAKRPECLGETSHCGEVETRLWAAEDNATVPRHRAGLDQGVAFPLPARRGATPRAAAARYCSKLRATASRRGAGRGARSMAGAAVDTGRGAVRVGGRKSTIRGRVFHSEAIMIIVSRWTAKDKFTTKDCPSESNIISLGMWSPTFTGGLASYRIFTKITFRLRPK